MITNYEALFSTITPADFGRVAVLLAVRAPSVKCHSSPATPCSKPCKAPA